ncbi:hypothetical protein GCM10011571_02220 [Marinithermofilum abyssi]|uniref:Uncharacterized protein n=1 Tax=Marinithermofilum abyssi TaxID=1571185 RepID=A0A8J2VCD0_9BACL|nr:hypothetical protein [Marinithermofilum abyssi]GGE04726.1 hypothetical protein GCM10011571_02220 [Marinithermofilum abyssi]
MSAMVWAVLALVIVGVAVFMVFLSKRRGREVEELERVFQERHHARGKSEEEQYISREHIQKRKGNKGRMAFTKEGDEAKKSPSASAPKEENDSGEKPNGYTPSWKREEKKEDESGEKMTGSFRHPSSKPTEADQGQEYDKGSSPLSEEPEGETKASSESKERLSRTNRMKSMGSKSDEKKSGGLLASLKPDKGDGTQESEPTPSEKPRRVPVAEATESWSLPPRGQKKKSSGDK